MAREQKKIFFISDTHFGHENVLKFGREFASIQEMNELLIKNWNERVSGNDTVYILGDMFFRAEASDVESILSRLKGKKHLILGNHDGSWVEKVDTSLYFQSVSNMLEVSDGKRGLTLCHYPLLTWKHAKKSYMIHGHLHSDTSDDFWPLLKARDRVLNAGVDINGMKPVTFEELVENNIRFKEEN